MGSRIAGVGGGGLAFLSLVVLAGCGAGDQSNSGDRGSVAPPSEYVAPGVAGGGGSALNPAGTTSPSTTAPATNTPGTTATSMAARLPIPCAPAKAVANNCQKCHGATPIGGAPMSLLTYDDFQKPAKTQPMLKVYQLAQMRVNSTTKPMPPGGGLASADLGALNGWFQAGAGPGTDADRMCAPASVPGTTGTTGTMGNTSTTITSGTLSPDMAPLVALPGETCYDLLTHQSTTSVDTTKYSVSTGEHYEQFYYSVPWPSGSLGTRFGAKFDNLQVLHHWLLFTTAKNVQPGFHETTSGSQLGDTAALIAGWAVGGRNVEMPADVGFDLPDSGTMLNLQWHFFNSTGQQQMDGTAVQVCTVPAGSRPKIGSITWLGTENFNGPTGMPAGQMSNWEGTCDPSRTGMNATDPIHIFFFWPHMHQLGINMASSVTHNGVTTEVFNKPFDFNHQIHYDASVDLFPGDTITATCTFNNTTPKNVPFGPSSTQEMCYQFAFAYPAHALDNGVISLIGASNTCW